MRENSKKLILKSRAMTESPRLESHNNMNQPQPACLILGASTRAAAQSAVRAGYAPVCADQFADADLCAIARVLPLQNYPHDLAAQVTTLPPIRWMYTGALENSPPVIQAVSEHHLLWGNGADVVQAVRNQQKMYQVLKKHNLPALGLRQSDNPPPANGHWVLKPKRSAGGREVMVWDAKTKKKHRNRLPPSDYFQQQANGDNYSALYLASSSQTTLIGISAQLVGCDWLNAKEFIWCGNVAPVLFSDQDEVHHSLMQQAQQTGSVIAKEFGLRGLFGIDFILENRDQHQTLFPLEVNPRYVASVELFERAYKTPLLNWHIVACESFEQPQQGNSVSAEIHQQPFSSIQPDEACGKAILYADRTFAFPLTIEEMPNCADIPPLGRLIQQNEPICTVFATGKTTEACKINLLKKAKEIYLTLK